MGLTFLASQHASNRPTHDNQDNQDQEQYDRQSISLPKAPFSLGIDLAFMVWRPGFGGRREWNWHNLEISLWSVGTPDDLKFREVIILGQIGHGGVLG
jgi:hypothetical protein